MALHRRSPRSLAHALTPLQASLSPGTLLGEVQAAWSATVGELIAEQARPVAERAGTITVRCSAAVWAQEIDLMSTDIIGRLNERLSDPRLTSLRCVVGEAG